MKYLNICKHLSPWSSAVTILLAIFTSRASGNYFIIEEPHAAVQWQNNAANLVTWEKALLDDVIWFDVELARMSTDGLILVAMNVPAKSRGSLNIYLQDIPSGDDYFLFFINSTHGLMHATSSRFTVLDSSSTPTGSVPSPAQGAPTITISGSPNPTRAFASTFPASSNGAAHMLSIPTHFGTPFVVTVFGILLGAVWTFL